MILTSLHKIAQLISSGKKIWIKVLCFQSPFSSPLCFSSSLQSRCLFCFQSNQPLLSPLLCISGLLSLSHQRNTVMSTPSSWVNPLSRSPSYLLPNVWPHILVLPFNPPQSSIYANSIANHSLISALQQKQQKSFTFATLTTWWRGRIK